MGPDVFFPLNAEKDAYDVLGDDPRVKKKIKQSRKRKFMTRHRKKTEIKEERLSPIDCKLGVHCLDTGPVNGNQGCAYDCEDLKQPVPLFNTCEESYVNNSILSEVLAEKKRALLESPAMVQFLKDHLGTAC